jgi:hypothetical protein
MSDYQKGFDDGYTRGFNDSRETMFMEILRHRTYLRLDAARMQNTISQEFIFISLKLIDDIIDNCNKELEKCKPTNI